MLPEDDRKEFDSLDDFVGDRSLLDDAPREAPLLEDAPGEARESRGFTTAEPDDTFDSFDHFLTRENRTRFPGMTSAQRKIGVAMVLTAIIAGGALASVLLFQQTLNPPPTSGPAVLTRNCDPVNPTPATIITGTNGFVIWTCTPSESAFFVNAAGTVTPTISKGAEWTTTYIYKETGTAPTTTCSSASINKAVTSGTPVAFSGAEIGGWRYCADYVNAPSVMSSITYTWSQ